MRAAVYTETGPSSVLRIVERPVPAAAPGDVVVRLHRAGVNPTDWKFRAGLTQQTHAETIPGQDGAGVVHAVGEGVTGLAVGDPVWVYLCQHDRPGGTAAEYTAQPAHHVVPLPGGDVDLGACLGVPALTAHRMLTCGDVDRLAPGTLDGVTVLVAGGAGAVGHAAIQLARWAGATVLTTVSSEAKGRLATAAGAHHVLDYTAEGVTERIKELAPDGVDQIVEVAPAQNLALDLEVIRNHGTIGFYANNGGPEAALPLRPAFSKNIRLQGAILYTLRPDQLAAAVDDVSAAVAAGAMPVGEEHGLPLHHFPLDQVATAHDAVEAGAVGKVVLDLT